LAVDREVVRMDGVVARDPRVAAILTRPDDYFSRARARAWLAAGHDVRSDLRRRRLLRRGGRRTVPAAVDRY
jgi:hypothetical protein